MTPKEFWLTAAQWGSYMHSGDPGACMYGFDERGVVQSEAHRKACIAYLDGECRKAADVNEDPKADHAQIDSLIAYLSASQGLDEFTEGYITAALWSSNDDDDNPLDEMYGIDDIAPETLARMSADCAAFQKANASDLAAFQEVTGRPASHAGHDFWLTRCGHGAGFWDRGAGDVGDRLTEAAQAFGDVDLYVGDDGKIWQ
jgi:hypothetical protein